MGAVEITGLTKEFSSTTALDNVDLQVPDGEFLVLVGPSGCGKTTCLRIIAGLDSPTSGRVIIGGNDVTDISPRDRDIAMVFQNYALYPHMTVFDNMAFALKLRHVGREEVANRVSAVARMLNIEQYLMRRPAELSGGQRQRVALGRAVVREPQCFLMDEPLSNLDAKLRVQTRAELIRLHKRLGITTIYVTHDQVEAMTMGDRIAVMDQGVIQQCDSPLAIFNRPVNRFVAGFIGNPPMNFMDVTVEEINGTLWLSSEHLRLQAASAHCETLSEYRGCTVTLGIRPTDMYDASLPGLLAPEASNTIEGTVDVVEPMGATALVYMQFGRQPVMASFDSSTSAAEGQVMRVCVDTGKCHYFDAETGCSLLFQAACQYH